MSISAFNKAPACFGSITLANGEAILVPTFHTAGIKTRALSGSFFEFFLGPYLGFKPSSFPSDFNFRPAYFAYSNQGVYLWHIFCALHILRYHSSSLQSAREIVVVAFYVVGLNLTIIQKYLIIILVSFAIISVLLFPIRQISPLRFLSGMRSKDKLRLTLA